MGVPFGIALGKTRVVIRHGARIAREGAKFDCENRISLFGDLTSSNWVLWITEIQ